MWLVATNVTVGLLLTTCLAAFLQRIRGPAGLLAGTAARLELVAGDELATARIQSPVQRHS